MKPSQLVAAIRWVDNLRTPNAIRLNPLGTLKVCSFDCAYCEFGPSTIRLNQLKSMDWPTPADLVTELGHKLTQLAEQGKTIERITLVGPGEVTIYPNFGDLTTKVRTLRDQIFPTAKLGVFVNGSYLEQRKVFQFVELYDEVFCKFDVGTDRSLRLLNRPLIRAECNRILEAYRRFKNVILMSVFVGGDLRNERDEDLIEWMEIIGIIQPQRVVISTASRMGYDQSSSIQPLTEDDLEVIAAKFRRKHKIPIDVSFLDADE